jgi:hypothetical protein
MPDDEEVVEAIPIEPDLAHLAPPDGQRPRDQNILELLKVFAPVIIPGDFQQANRWAQHYGLRPENYYIALDPSRLRGLAPNRHIIILVGTYRINRTWEMAEMVQHLVQVGVRVVHGGPF